MFADMIDIRSKEKPLLRRLRGCQRKVVGTSGRKSACGAGEPIKWLVFEKFFRPFRFGDADNGSDFPYIK